MRAREGRFDEARRLLAQARDALEKMGVLELPDLARQELAALPPE